ncbi:Putative signal transduction protein with CBS domains (fragment) [Paraburkholderia piptadeniae]|uniref:Signal transduction protein with CBS domains n=1 Tax=Paraburkholderia piptadeniae TaxID=1701573 RepID=A0A1N7SWZ3_9BURK
MAASPRDPGTLDRRVHQIMSRKPVTVSPDAQVNDASQS